MSTDTNIALRFSLRSFVRPSRGCCQRTSSAIDDWRDSRFSLAMKTRTIRTLQSVMMGRYRQQDLPLRRRRYSLPSAALQRLRSGDCAVVDHPPHLIFPIFLLSLVLIQFQHLRPSIICHRSMRPRPSAPFPVKHAGRRLRSSPDLTMASQL